MGKENAKIVLCPFQNFALDNYREMYLDNMVLKIFGKFEKN